MALTQGCVLGPGLKLSWFQVRLVLVCHLPDETQAQVSKKTGWALVLRMVELSSGTYRRVTDLNAGT